MTIKPNFCDKFKVQGRNLVLNFKNKPTKIDCFQNRADFA